MAREISLKTIDDRFRQKIKEISGQNFQQCFQCGTCSGSCPMTEHLDLMPRQVMALIQFGQADALDVAKTPFVCASCHTCMVRCPRGLDLTKIMEAVRLVKLRRNVNEIEPSNLQPEDVTEMPQVAMVSGFRKLTS
ncbi:heterodisulfide reductase [candidate division GN15 bacterium]|nr:heterodisulfide reductase [candidate division GN15 bacterium]